MEGESLTLGELVAIDTLRSEVIAGARGLDRRVVWAHSCELDDPWLWLAPGELLMTIGFCVPREPEAQVRFVRELDEAGVVGAMLGERNTRLSLSEEMLAEADRRGFPLMRTQHQVPWSAVARHVAAASSSSQASQVLTLAKLYELTAASENAQELADGIARLLRIQLEVTEDQGGFAILRSSHDRRAEEKGALEVRVRAHRLTSRHAATLEIGELSHDGLSAMVLVHLKRVIEVEADRILFRASAQAEEAEAALEQLLVEERGAAASGILGKAALRHGYRVLAFAETEAPRIGKACAVRGLPVLVGRNGEAGLILAPAGVLDRVRDLLAELSVAAGASSVVKGWGDARGAVSEAMSALVDAQSSRSAWVEFEGARVAVLARSEREAREIIREVLGPLAEDNARAAMLRETLFTYLRHERSWAESSAELGIHRQTLAYRLRKVEALTARTISRTEDLAALWIAAQAWERFGPDSRSAG
ncbi:PucR family transcriptional regulator [Leucobacter chromiisoli]|nr:PucR family transcriptional regulator [Leucobacter chromiisoli]